MCAREIASEKGKASQADKRRTGARNRVTGIVLTCDTEIQSTDTRRHGITAAREQHQKDRETGDRLR